MKKKAPRRLKGAVVGAMFTAATCGLLLLNFGKGKPISVPAYSVLRVIDGDTFETTEKQLIRLASTDAPETGLCGSQAAKEALEKLVLGKPVYLKVLYRDPYYRLVSQVYTQEGYVNKILISQGYAYYHNRDKNVAEELKPTSDQARQEENGIFGLPCTQMKNITNPQCVIKGNVREENIYFTPDCRQYKTTEVQLYLGDRWFCSEKDARQAGFRKGKQC